MLIFAQLMHKLSEGYAVVCEPRIYEGNLVCCTNCGKADY
jgi:hypothetical protein